MKHYLPDCLLVWLTPYLQARDFAHENEMCDQFWADYKWDGVNAEVVKSVRSGRWTDRARFTK